MARYYLHLPNGLVWPNEKNSPMSFTKLNYARAYAIRLISQFYNKNAFKDSKSVSVSTSTVDNDAGVSEYTAVANVSYSPKESPTGWTFSFADMKYGSYVVYELHKDGSLGHIIQNDRML